MTVNAALGLVVSNAATAKAGARGAGTADTRAHGFDDALKGNAGKRHTRDAREDAAGSTPAWKMAVDGPGVKLAAERTQPETDATGDPHAAFAMLLDEALADAGASEAGDAGDTADIVPDIHAENLDVAGTAAPGDEVPVKMPAPQPAFAAAGPGDDQGDNVAPDDAADPAEHARNRGTRDQQPAAPWPATTRTAAERGEARNTAGTGNGKAASSAPAGGEKAGGGDPSPATAQTQPPASSPRPALPAGEAQPRPVAPYSGAPHSGAQPSLQGEAPATAQPGADDTTKQKEPGPRVTAPAAANDATGARVSVLSYSAAPAPAPALTTAPALGVTAAGLVSAIGADSEWRAAAQETGSTGNPRGPSLSGVSSLRIQLNPAELGMVTARLTASGTQLSIEIQVESNDARQRLSADTDAILKALRAVGYDVEKVTIQQAQPNANGNAQQGPASRDQALSNQQGQADEGAKGQRGGNAAGDDGQGGTRNGPGDKGAERHSGGGLYI